MDKIIFQTVAHANVGAGMAAYTGGNPGAGFLSGALGTYGLYGTYNDYFIKNRLTGDQAAMDFTFGAIGFAGWQGALWNASYELGKIAGPSTWYGSDNSSWFR